MPPLQETSTRLRPLSRQPVLLRVPIGDAVACRAPGDRVAAGEPLTSNSPANAHIPLAPRSGVLRGKSIVMMLDGSKGPALEIEPHEPAKGADDANSDATDFPAIATTDLPHWIDRLRAAGVGASRHGCPHLIDQLLATMRRRCDVVLVSLLEEPLAAALIRERPKEIAAGIRVVCGTVGPAKTLVAYTADHNTPLPRDLKQSVAGLDIRWTPRESSYPAADPTLLLHDLLGRRLRPGRMPAEGGVVLIDAPAAAAIGAVALRGQPMLDVPLAVHDLRDKTWRLFTVAPGTAVLDVVRELTPGAAAESVSVRAGDLLRDVLAAPTAIIDGVGELVLHVADHFAARLPPADPCVRCGWCVSVCPTRVHPAGLLEAAQQSDAMLAERFGVHACIECGLCSYVCPSRLPLLPSIRALRRGRVA